MKKKIAITLVSLLVVVVMALSFAACGVGGKYKFYSLTVTVFGEERTAQAGEDLDMGGGWTYPVSENDMILTLNRDGTCTMSTNMFGKSSHAEGTWEEVDGKVNILVDGKVTSTFTVDGNKLVMKSEGMTFILKK